MAKKRATPKAETISEDAIKAALAWPLYEKPEPISHTDLKERTKVCGYGKEGIRLWTYNAYSRRVTLGCVNSVHHSSDGGVPTSQTQGGPWFDTEAEAFKAMRWVVTSSFANELLSLDQRVPPTDLSSQSI